jgi:hypothetical protein
MNSYFLHRPRRRVHQPSVFTHAFDKTKYQLHYNDILCNKVIATLSYLLSIKIIVHGVEIYGMVCFLLYFKQLRLRWTSGRFLKLRNLDDTFALGTSRPKFFCCYLEFIERRCFGVNFYLNGPALEMDSHVVQILTRRRHEYVLPACSM